MTDYLVLAALWVAWCGLHSLLINPTVTAFAERRFPAIFPFYRVLYNLTALMTLLPVAAYSIALEGPEVVCWQGFLRWGQALLLLTALAFFIAGAGRYDLAQFLGIQQMRDQNACRVLTDDCRLDTGGVLGLVRHPWYTGGLLIIWARDLDGAAILTNLVISIYFVIGAFLEEHKLLAQFGAEYVAYQRRVSMFLPFKWAGRRLGKG